MPGVNALVMSGGGEHLLLRKVDGSFVSAKVGKKLEPKPVGLGGMQMRIDPRQEWAMIFDEAWRMERDYFYAPNMHGLDWKAVYDRYKPLIAHVGRREDLTALIVEMIGELNVGHNNSGGGDIYRESAPAAGLLGADFEIDNGRYRIARVYTGEKWNPFLKAPLASAHPRVVEGDYIEAINGQPLTAKDNIFERLQGLAGKQVTLRISKSGRGKKARDVTVEATDDDSRIRLWWW